MVSSQDRRCGGKAQNDDDRCTCPKASDRTVAHGYDRRNPRWCRVADRSHLNILSRSSKSSFSVLCALATAADHDPRWWCPEHSRGLKPCPEWARRLGASPRKRIVASWSGSRMDPTEYKVAARASRPSVGSPRINYTKPRTPKDIALQ